MSLDVYLEGPEESYWCPHCGQNATRRPELFSANITHNLGKMAEAAGVYYACWRPEEILITTAAEMIPYLRKGIELMENDPPRFEALNSPNGWGLYENFLPWLREYLTACEANPTATVEASR